MIVLGIAQPSYKFDSGHPFRRSAGNLVMVRLAVSPDHRAEATRPGRLLCPDVPPVAGFSYSPPNPFTKEKIHFTDLSYDIDGSIVNWTWYFGDGSVGYGPSVYHMITELTHTMPIKNTYTCAHTHTHTQLRRTGAGGKD